MKLLGGRLRRHHLSLGIYANCVHEIVRYRVALERQKYIGASTPLSTPKFIRTMRGDTHDLSPRRPEVVVAVNRVKFHDDIPPKLTSTFNIEIIIRDCDFRLVRDIYFLCSFHLIHPLRICIKYYWRISIYRFVRISHFLIVLFVSLVSFLSFFKY